MFRQSLARFGAQACHILFIAKYRPARRRRLLYQMIRKRVQRAPAFGLTALQALNIVVQALGLNSPLTSSSIEPTGL